MPIKGSKKCILSVLVLLFVFLTFTSTAQLRMISGSYVGTGSDDRTISGIGFQPDMIIVKEVNAANEAQIRLSNMPDGYSKQMVGVTGMYLDRIQSFTSDGFVVGLNNDVNASGKTYVYMAFQAGSRMVIGSFTGDGTTGRPLNGLGFQPDLVYLIPAADQRIAFKTPTITGDNSSSFGGDFTLDGTILSLDADGFTVGSNARANKIGDQFFYAAFKSSPTSMVYGSYLGTGSAKSITGVGFKSKYLFIKSSSSAYACQTSDAMTNGTSVEFAGSSTDISRITDVNSDGFAVGTNSQVNTNGVIYHYVCFNDYYSPPSSCITTGRYTGDGLINHEVTGLGFKPKVLIIKSSVSNEAQIRTNTMNEGGSKPMTGTSAIYTGRISSFTNDGFTVGNNADVNSLSKSYNYVAFDASPLIYTGTYVGNGLSGRAVTGVPFQPGMVFVMPSGSAGVHWRSRTFVNSNCSNFGSTAMSIAATILSLTADGFTVGNSTKANAAGQIYHFVAFKEDPAFLQLGSYLGNGTTGRVIDVPGININYLMVKSEKSGSVLQKNLLMGVKTTVPFTGSEATGRINYMGLAGFEVTNSSLVNYLGTNYHYAAFQLCTLNGQGIWWRGNNSNPSNDKIVKPATNQIADEFTVFPNPANGYFMLKVGSKKTEKSTIILQDLSGRIISSYNISLAVGTNNFSINVTGLPAGMYVVRMTGVNGLVRSSKIMVND